MPHILPLSLYSCEQVRKLDAVAINEEGIAGIRLMKRAARAALEQLLKKWPSPEVLCVFCGGGNNGGDGYILATLASQRKIPVRVFPVAPPERLREDAETAYQYALQFGVDIDSVQNFPKYNLRSAIIVDAIVGSGYAGKMRPEVGKIIALINQSMCPVVSLDLPSGLDGDTGAAALHAVKADLTVSFVGLKQGLMTGRGPALRGELCYSSLDIPERVFDKLESKVSLIKKPKGFAAKSADAHKGDFGHVLVIGGDLGMGGAAILAAEAALRSGAGLVTLATRPEHVTAALTRIPEVMTLGLSSCLEMGALVQRATVLVIGPGLGKTAWSEQMLYIALQSEIPTIVDADALNLLAQKQGCETDARRWLMTPHPGEAARLLSVSVADVQSDRISAVKRVQNLYSGSVVILKGAGSLICTEEGVSVANVGNPGMAVAGMGDVLSGVLAGLVAQGLTLEDAAAMGVYVHGRAGDWLSERDGERGMKASDIIPTVRRMLNSVPVIDTDAN